MIRHLHEFFESNFCRGFYKVSLVSFTNFLDLIFGWNLTLGPTMQHAPLSALAWRSKAHKQNNPFSIRRWKDCPSRSPSFNTLNEEHGTYGGGWGEIDESNLSIQLQHCNYTVVVVVAQTTTAHCKFYRFFCSFSVSLRLDSWGWNKIDKWQKSRNERCDLTKKTLVNTCHTQFNSKWQETEMKELIVCTGDSLLPPSTSPLPFWAVSISSRLGGFEARCVAYMLRS